VKERRLQAGSCQRGGEAFPEVAVFETGVSCWGVYIRPQNTLYLLLSAACLDFPHTKAFPNEGPSRQNEDTWAWHKTSKPRGAISWVLMARGTVRQKCPRVLFDRDQTQSTPECADSHLVSPCPLCLPISLLSFQYWVQVSTFLFSHVLLLFTVVSLFIQIKCSQLSVVPQNSTVLLTTVFLYHFPDPKLGNWGATDHQGWFKDAIPSWLQHETHLTVSVRWCLLKLYICVCVNVHVCEYVYVMCVGVMCVSVHVMYVCVWVCVCHVCVCVWCVSVCMKYVSVCMCIYVMHVWCEYVWDLRVGRMSVYDNLGCWPSPSTFLK